MLGHGNLETAQPAATRSNVVGRFAGAPAAPLADGPGGHPNGAPPGTPGTPPGPPPPRSRLGRCCDWFFCCRCGSRAAGGPGGGRGGPGVAGEVEMKPREPPATPGGPGVPPMPSADEDPAGEPTPVDPVTGVSRLEALWVDAGGRGGGGPGAWNRARHRSAEYAAGHVVTRRGGPVLLHAAFSRTPTDGVDRVSVELEIGSHPQLNKGTHLIFPVETRAAGEGDVAASSSSSAAASSSSTASYDDDTDCTSGAWWASGGLTEAGGANGRNRALWLRVRADCLVGKWRLFVSTQGPAGSHRSARREESDIYIIFNAWCPEDAVFMEVEAWRREYVLADTGRIYYGTEQQIGSRPWNYGQFEKDVLEASVMIMDRASLPLAGRGCPVKVVRIVSAMVNSLDDDGVLEGNWSGDYGGGTAPTAWNGSVDILQQFARSRSPVRYGQCWVFSGVTTTVLRSVGIPTRSVTNFASAHDTDTSLTTDVYLDDDLQPIAELNTDSVWNFHVWNDCWMTRPDLPEGLGGWQAVDATPQETSSGVFCCGPASVAAVRNGLVYLTHDTPFVFAEVNSDRIFWLRSADGTVKRLDVERRAIGHCISTKAVGSDTREDITHLYKFPEDTEEERLAVETACLHGSRPDTYRGSPSSPDVTLAISTHERVVMGHDFDVSVTVSSTAVSERQVSVFVRGAVMHYTGVTRGEAIKQLKLDVTLQPGEERVLTVTVRQGEYLERLVDQSAVMFLVSARVNPGNAILTRQHCFRLCTPKLLVTCADECRVGEPLTVEVVMVMMLLLLMVMMMVILLMLLLLLTLSVLTSAVWASL
uniref:Protein-glutamine gamma-glutamyltransferase K n=1 Tax=Petromyzon marinus TaxID=7757 RepID=A0AAJ7UE67_PETMA|nr:protein-glutamine gamma-glutamyltransferase K-like isoform X3 [Petromyzon marinus]